MVICQRYGLALSATNLPTDLVPILPQIPWTSFASEATVGATIIFFEPGPNSTKNNSGERANTFVGKKHSWRKPVIHKIGKDNSWAPGSSVLNSERLGSTCALLSVEDQMPSTIILEFMESIKPHHATLILWLRAYYAHIHRRACYSFKRKVAAAMAWRKI